MDLSLRRDECATEEKDESSKGEDGSGYELDVGAHSCWILKSSANMPTKMRFLQIFCQKVFQLATKRSLRTLRCCLLLRVSRSIPAG